MLTAKQAMESAIECAAANDIAAGHLWLGIATELRIGEWLMSGVKGIPLAQPPFECCPDCVERCTGRCTQCHDLPQVTGEPATVQCPMCTATSQDMAAHMADYHSAGETDWPAAARRLAAVTVPAPEPAYRRAETEVIQRIADEATPAYEAAGDSLGETKSIPTRIAHPRPDDRGPTSECLSCELPVLWIRGRGWCHEVPSHTASCDKAELEARHG